MAQIPPPEANDFELGQLNERWRNFDWDELFGLSALLAFWRMQMEIDDAQAAIPNIPLQIHWDNPADSAAA